MEPQARKVAKEPASQSRGRAPAKLRLNSRQPMVRPGMAAGVNSARTHSASEARNWMTMDALLGSRKFCRWVRAKYMAPMRAAWVMDLVFLFIEYSFRTEKPRKTKKWAQSTHPEKP